MNYLGYTFEPSQHPGGTRWTLIAPDGKTLGTAWSMPGAKRMVHVALGLDKCPQCGDKQIAHPEWSPVGRKCSLTRSQAASAMKRKRDAYARTCR